jgi:hypothetical protein
VDRAEFDVERVDLVRAERVEFLRPRLRVLAGLDCRVAGQVAPPDGGAERLSERRREPIAGPLGELRPPRGDIVDGTLQLGERPVAESPPSRREPLGKRVPRPLAAAVAG